MVTIPLTPCRQHRLRSCSPYIFIIATRVLLFESGVGMRLSGSWPLALVVVLSLSGCIADEGGGPSAAPGGVGIMANGRVMQGPNAISSVSVLPAGNVAGPIPPFGTRGHAAAYEFGSGYRVGSGDKLSIRVAGETDLSGEFPVDASGAISLPYVQSVTVAGLSTPQIEQMIAERLRRGFIRDPQVAVQVVSLRPFYIMGEVTTGGSYPYQPGLTVQQAIAVAQGFSARADKAAVLLTRRDARGTVTSKVPLATQVYPGDIIYVRERWF